MSSRFKIAALVVLAAGIALLAALVAVERYPGAKNLGSLKSIAKHKLWHLACVALDPLAATRAPPAEIRFEDATSRMGPERPSKTFSLAVADLDDNGFDDILIGAHEDNPYLLINDGENFADRSDVLFRPGFKADRHGYAFADLDDDGDLDLVVAGGGNDGIGKGTPNFILKNRGKPGELRFRKLSPPETFALQPGRGRAFIPAAGSDGRLVDLYYTTLTREGFPNLWLTNVSTRRRIAFEPANDSFLNLQALDHGRGVIADFDGDDRPDYAQLWRDRLTIIWNPASGRPSTTLSDTVFSVVAGDFNLDGKLDLFAGRFSPPTKSDHVSHDDSRIVFAVNRNHESDSNGLRFRAESPSLRFNLKQHRPAFMTGQLKDADDIFIGKQRRIPDARQFELERSQAAGKPPGDAPGTYIWFENDAQTWHVQWKFHDDPDFFIGSIEGQALHEVTQENATTIEPIRVQDLLFINHGDGEFSTDCIQLPHHRGVTAGVTAADFNNDGWLDIAGVRHDEVGAPNGAIFILTNREGHGFDAGTIDLRPGDLLRRSDLIAHGFFDDDRLPDLVLTNGFGQHPGTGGTPRLLLNRSDQRNEGILIRLRGTTANHYGVGAVASLLDRDGVLIGHRVQGLNTNISQDTLRMHFGTAGHASPYTLRVSWPDGRQSVHEIPGEGTLDIVQPE